MASIAWNKDIKSLVRQFTVFTQEDAFDAFEQAAVDVAEDILNNTPLGLPNDEGGTRGKLKNNWQIGREVSDRVLNGQNPNKGRGYASSKILGKLRGQKVDGIYTGQKSLFMFNNLDYAPIVEYGGYPTPVKRGTYWKKSKRWEKRSKSGFSKQAPRGMMRLGSQKFNSFFKRRYKIT